MDHPNTPADTAKTNGKRRKPYQKPTLVVHGTVGELTQSGGVRRRDGFRTRLLS